MDAQLVVNQIKRVYSVGNEALRPYYKEVLKLMRYFKKLDLIHVPREYNQEADHLAKSKLEEYIKIK